MESLNVEDGNTYLFTHFSVLITDHSAKWQKISSSVNISTSQYKVLLQRVVTKEHIEYKKDRSGYTA